MPRADQVWRANAEWTIPVLPSKTGSLSLELNIDYFFTRHRSNDAFYNYTSQTRRHGRVGVVLMDFRTRRVEELAHGSPEETAVLLAGVRDFLHRLLVLVIALRACVLYVAPPGRMVNWSTWTSLVLEKANWQAVHTIFAFLFVVAMVPHLLQLAGHRGLREDETRTRASGERRELALASAVLAPYILAAHPWQRTAVRHGDELRRGRQELVDDVG